MAYTFGDGFDCYAASTDALIGYWDTGSSTSISLQTGRFTGSRALQVAGSGAIVGFSKNSGSNDSVHHLVLAYYTNSVAGVGNGLYFQFRDGATNQCTLMFLANGNIVLQSGGVGGTALATWTGGVPAASVWTAYEIEVVIHNTAGSITIRRNGNTSNDFTLGSLNTRAGTTNNYANQIGFGNGQNTGVNTIFDDFLWRSDASSVPWVGDIRCYTRMPAADASVQFSRSATSATMSVAPVSTTVIANTVSRYAAVTAPLNGTVSSVTVSLAAGFTGNIKCALFTATGGVIQSATAILNNPVIGNNTFSFSPALALTKGTVYYFGFITDVNPGGAGWNTGSGSSGATFSTTYAAFPSQATLVTGNGQVISATLTSVDNCSFVNEAQQDGATSYVYDNNTGDADFYSVGLLPGLPPLSTVCVITRGFVSKSDAGNRQLAMQLKSGGTTVQTAPPFVLATDWNWVWRTDMVDPATSAAWTANAVNNAQIGPIITT